MFPPAFETVYVHGSLIPPAPFKKCEVRSFRGKLTFVSRLLSVVFLFLFLPSVSLPRGALSPSFELWEGLQDGDCFFPV